MNWQPIETAPTDLTDIILFPGAWSVTVGRYDADNWIDALCQDNEIYPTHWMPLPSPPVNETATGKPEASE